jgi:hypothetical protein
MAYFRSVQESLRLDRRDAFGDRLHDTSIGRDFSSLVCTDAYGQRRHAPLFEQVGTSGGSDFSGRKFYCGANGGKYSDYNYAVQTLQPPVKYELPVHLLPPTTYFEDRVSKIRCSFCGQKYGHAAFCQSRY